MLNVDRHDSVQCCWVQVKLIALVADTPIIIASEPAASSPCPGVPPLFRYAFTPKLHSRDVTSILRPRSFW